MVRFIVSETVYYLLQLGEHGCLRRGLFAQHGLPSRVHGRHFVVFEVGFEPVDRHDELHEKHKLVPIDGGERGWMVDGGWWMVVRECG